MALFARYNPIPHYPAVPMHTIVTSVDNIVLKALHTPMIRRRIGVEPVEGIARSYRGRGNSGVMDGMVAG
jgi:hypothetical protein